MNETQLITVAVIAAAIILMAIIIGPAASGSIIGRVLYGLLRLICLITIWLFRLLYWVVVGLFRGTHMPSFINSFGGRTPPILGPEARGRRQQIQGDYLDYRGTAQVGEIADRVNNGDLPCGRLVTPNGKVRSSLMLPMSHLHRGCLVVGPTGSGKTESVILPWITSLLHRGSSVVTVDVKGELYHTLSSSLSGSGVRIWHWCAGNPGSMAWNWLAAIRDERDVEATVRSILGKRNPNDPQPFFYERDYRWLRTLINITHAAYGTNARPSVLLMLLSNRQNITEIFHQYPSVRSFDAAISDLMQLSSEEFSRASSGLLNALHLFSTREVQQVSEQNGIDLSRISEAPTLLIIGAPLADAQRSETLSAIMLNILFNECYRRFGNQCRAPLFFIIDEAARLRNRIDYEETLSILRGAGAGMCLAAQDITQFGDEQQQSAIVANCLTMMVLRGCSPDTASAFASRCGDRHEQFQSQTTQRGYFDLLPDQQGQSMQTSSIPVLRPREIMYPPQKCGQYCGFIHATQISHEPFLINLTHRSSRVV